MIFVVKSKRERIALKFGPKLPKSGMNQIYSREPENFLNPTPLVQKVTTIGSKYPYFLAYEILSSSEFPTRQIVNKFCCHTLILEKKEFSNFGIPKNEIFRTEMIFVATNLQTIIIRRKKMTYELQWSSGVVE